MWGRHFFALMILRSEGGELVFDSGRGCCIMVSALRSRFGWSCVFVLLVFWVFLSSHPLVLFSFRVRVGFAFVRTFLSFGASCFVSRLVWWCVRVVLWAFLFVGAI